MADSTNDGTARWELLKTAFAIAKHELDMPADVLREAVPSWGFPRLSQCTKADLRAIINRMTRWFTGRPEAQECTQSLLDYMQHWWKYKSQKKDKASLQAYLANSFDVPTVRLMSRDMASKVIQSLKAWND